MNITEYDIEQLELNLRAELEFIKWKRLWCEEVIRKDKYRENELKELLGIKKEKLEKGLEK